MALSRVSTFVLDRASRLLDGSFECASAVGRGLAMLVYPLLAALAVFQLLNPTSVDTIASQNLGRAMFGLLAGLLLIAATCALASSVVSRDDLGLDPSGVPVLGFSDALLHLSVAVVYTHLAVGEYLLEPSAWALIIGALGLLLVGTGGYVGLHPIRPLRRNGREITQRDKIVRGLIFTAIGGVLFFASVMSSADALMFTPYAPAPLIVIIAALSAYGFHTLWMTGKASDIPLV